MQIARLRFSARHKSSLIGGYFVLIGGLLKGSGRITRKMYNFKGGVLHPAQTAHKKWMYNYRKFGMFEELPLATEKSLASSRLFIVLCKVMMACL